MLRILPQDYLTAKRLKLASLGFVYPATMVAEARKTGLPLYEAAALLKMETGGGRNVYGHDKVRNPIGQGAVVTPENYKQYLDYRNRGLGNQGVGPCQLTSTSLQTAADREGGCDKPWINMRVGFRFLNGLKKVHGVPQAYRAYNGSGPAADTYMHHFQNYVNTFREKFK